MLNQRVVLKYKSDIIGSQYRQITVFQSRNRYTIIKVLALIFPIFEHLACGLTNLVNIFFPEVLALSGGVANQGDALLLPLRERVRERSFGSRYAVSHTRIELCTLGYRAGVIGAAMLARE